MPFAFGGVEGASRRDSAGRAIGVGRGRGGEARRRRRPLRVVGRGGEGEQASGEQGGEGSNGGGDGNESQVSRDHCGDFQEKRKETQ